MARGRYYTPAARILPCTGVERKKLDGRADMFTGEAGALEECGLLRADMLPAPGGCSVSWRPEGVEREQGESWCYVPGYLEIRRHPGGGLRVFLVVSRDEQAARRAHEQERARERARQCEINAAANREEQEREAVSKETPEDFRKACAISAGYMRMYLDGACGRYPFKFPTDARDKIEAVLSQLAALIHSSEVLPLHPEKASAGKAHLRLAWSA